MVDLLGIFNLRLYCFSLSGANVFGIERLTRNAPSIYLVAD